MPLCHYVTTAYRRELLPNRMREPHNPRENIIPCLTQIQTLKERHTKLQPKAKPTNI